MIFSLGFDGGGTKTQCVLIDESGAEVSQNFSGASNPLRIGFAQAQSSLTTAATATLSAARLQPSDIAAVCAGIAGAGRPGVTQRLGAFLRESFPASFVHVTTDIEVALEAAAGSSPGVILIAGTGSSAYGRNAAGETVRVGGYGPWTGDEGSAYDVGRRAVAAVFRARDAGAPATFLADRILPAADSSSWDELIEKIAAGPDLVFPRLFPVVVEAADAGDSIARKLLTHAATQLAQMASTLVERLKMAGEEFPLAKTGGVFGRSGLLDSRLDELLHAAAPRAKIGALEVSPALGAARLALRLAAGRAPTGHAHGR